MRPTGATRLRMSKKVFSDVYYSSQHARKSTHCNLSLGVSIYHAKQNSLYDHRTTSYCLLLQVIPTPLTRLCWWRVCLDEAQMVETSTAKAAEMAGKLAARHRWCITGTPLSRGLEDLYGLLFFLRTGPLQERFWWNRVCQRPYEAGSQAGVASTLTHNKDQKDSRCFALRSSRFTIYEKTKTK